VPDVEERFADALHATSRSWRQAVDRRLKSSGVSQASCMAIAVAAEAQTPLSQSELADRLGVEGATMVAMMDRLVKAGLLERQPSEDDRRVNRVIVTAAGLRLADAVKSDAAAVRKELLAEVDPKKLAVATEFLETLKGVIDRAPRLSPAKKAGRVTG
jgi:MarR family transcriptional regulator, transcriptional regulator for hemolysin